FAVSCLLGRRPMRPHSQFTQPGDPPMTKQSARSLPFPIHRGGAVLAAAAGVLLPVLPAHAAAPAEGTDTAVTIYSSARPGGIPPEYYRPLPGQGTPNAMGVPGYAMVRPERPGEPSRG